MVEAVIATAILLSAFIVIIGLFHNGLRYTAQIQNNLMAVMLAERKLDEMRTYASQMNNFQDWTPYNGVTATPPDYPDFQIMTTVANQTLYSGCGQIEMGMPAGEQRSLTQSAVLVQAQVTWDSNTHSTALTAVIGEPGRAPQALDPVIVTATSPIPTPLSRDALLQFDARAYDSAGNPIKDVLFYWSTAPIDGNGTLVQNRSGSTANLTNSITLPVIGTEYTGGQVRVQAQALINGTSVVGQSVPIQLQP